MLLPACEYCQDLEVVDGDGMLGECESASGVAEGADPKKGVGEGWHDVAREGGIGRELWEI